jgi:UDP-2-acetamido-3-amino-2,3-dideoxy-glucuronate N-acetyltransferase
VTAKAKPKIGVAGAGAWGRNLVRNCAEAGVLSAICDENATALSALAAEYRGVRTVDDYQRLLQLPLDAIVLATPASRHCEMALAAIESGKHVFVEKPFALRTDEAAAIVARADTCGVRTFAGHVLLYHPAIDELLRLVSEGAIGELRHVRSRRLGFGRLRSFENVWWSFAPHDVAVMLEIAGGFPSGCSSEAVDVAGSGIADFAYADYSFSHEFSAHVEVGWLEPERSHRLDVIGTRGTLTFADSRDGAALVLNSREIATSASGERSAKITETRQIPVREIEPLRAEIEAFVNSIETNSPTKTDGRSAIAVTKALAMAEACSLQAAAALV